MGIHITRIKIILQIIIAGALLSSCSTSEEKATDEQITVNTEVFEQHDSLVNSITGNATMKQIASYPSNVILTGLANHRLLSVYKSKISKKNQEQFSFRKYSSEYNGGDDENTAHYMPGIDILFGYNLLNIAHYDLTSEKGNYLFNHPVLIKTLYYPAFIQDSINKIPVNRDYYIVSVYDEDTNKDSLINKNDLRRFYHFDSTGTIKKKLIPANYSVVKSQYDSTNDLMYIFARHDLDKNGKQDIEEPIHVFWFSLKTPDSAKRLY